MNHTRADGGLGHQQADATKFPDGLQPVVQHINGAGLHFGIYTARGPHTCAGFTASCMFEAIDAAYYASINVSFVKDDSCGQCVTAIDTETDIETDYARMQQAINEVGQNMTLAFEGVPEITKVYTGVYGNARRVGHDIEAGWISMITLVDIGSGLWPYAHTDLGQGSFFNWLDFLQVGRGDFTPTDPRVNASDLGGVRARTHMSLFSAMKSLLFLGNRLVSAGHG
jgi:hypothetical protein